MAERGDSASRHDCSICLSSFQIPKILPCFHTFCLQCLEEYVIRNGKDGKFECPLCRVSTEIPVGGVKLFQSNFYIHGRNASEVNADCEVCGEGHEAAHNCTDCEENFCERCTTYHMKMKATREHTLLQLKDLSDKDGNCKRRIQKKYFCPQHKGEEIKMVCKDCGTKLCVVCKLTEHENHNTSSIAKEADEKRAILLNTIASAKTHLESLKTREYEAINIATSIEKALETSMCLLDKRVESVIAKVRKEADCIKQKLVKSNTKAKDYHLEKGRLVHHKIMEFESVIHHAQNVAELGDASQVLDANLVSKLQSVSLSEFSIKHSEYLILEEGFSDITVDLLGKMSTVSSLVTATEQGVLSCRPEAAQANALSIGTRRLYAAFTNRNTFLYHINTDASESYYTDWFYFTGTCAGLTCIDSDVYFTSFKHKTLYKLKTPEHVRTKFLSFEDYPHGIAHRPKRDNDKEQELLICCLKSSKLLETDASEGCVVAISISEKQQYTWRNKEMPGPTCIATNVLDGTVCLGYPAAHKVTLNASDGTVLTVFSGLGCPGNPERFCPVSVCFDSQCYIIIADYKNSAVIRIDESGNFLQCLVRGTIPLSVLVGYDNILYVGFDGKSITRYKLKPNK